MNRSLKSCFVIDLVSFEKKNFRLKNTKKSWEDLAMIMFIWIQKKCCWSFEKIFQFYKTVDDIDSFIEKNVQLNYIENRFEMNHKCIKNPHT